MGKSIETLSADIYQILDSSVDHTPNPAMAGLAASRIAGEMASATLPRSKPRELGKLWASDLGKSCYRQMWYQFNDPADKEPLLGHTKFKFLYGNLLEEALLYLAEEAGHEVSNTQARVEYTHPTGWVVSGRIDAIIDGALVDVKSTSSFGYAKYKKEGLTPFNDTFGYLYQLGFYKHFGQYGDAHYAPQDDGFVWIEKQNGHIMHTNTSVPTKDTMDDRIISLVHNIEKTVPPEIPSKLDSVPDGKSGNTKLCTTCSYCDFKHKCRPNLRTFLYSTGPRHLDKVLRAPNVTEVL
jgi:hypothetical protein